MVMTDLTAGMLTGGFVMAIGLLISNFLFPEMDTVPRILYSFAGLVVGSLLPTKG